MLERLKAAVGRDPWDRELRLVYADCLEEAGRPEDARDQRKAARKKQARPAKGPKCHVTVETADDRATYRMLRVRQIRPKCCLCGPNRGCNSGRRPSHSSWKKLRKHQWRPS
jgi:uncharacterized protein (TIGR02996 family)